MPLGSTVRTETAGEAAVVTGTGIGAVHTGIALLVVHIITVQSVARVHRVVHIILGTTVAVRIVIITVITVERQMRMFGAEKSGGHIDGTSSTAVRGGVVVLQHG